MDGSRGHTRGKVSRGLAENSLPLAASSVHTTLYSAPLCLRHSSSVVQRSRLSSCACVEALPSPILPSMSQTRRCKVCLCVCVYITRRAQPCEVAEFHPYVRTSRALGTPNERSAKRDDLKSWCRLCPPGPYFIARSAFIQKGMEMLEGFMPRAVACKERGGGGS